MLAVCEGCRGAFEARRRDARFCSSRCRSKSHASGVRAERLAAVPVSTVMVDAVRAELADLGVAESSLLAVEALVMARHMDASTGAATVAISRVLSEIMRDVHQLAASRPATVDELQVRRNQRPRGVPDGAE